MGRVARMGDVHTVVTAKPEGNTPLGLDRDDIKMDLKVIVSGNEDWLHLSCEPTGPIKDGEYVHWLSTL